MAEIEPPYSHGLRAALGWLELGDVSEAEAELNRLPARFAGTIEVLSIRWDIQAKRKDWVSALFTSNTLVNSTPERPEGWIKRSYSLHELKRTREAWENLLQVEKLFPAISIVPYNLACYACQLGEHDEAMQRLTTAMQIGSRKEIKATALKDRDLEPLWDKIQLL